MRVISILERKAAAWVLLAAMCVCVPLSSGCGDEESPPAPAQPDPNNNSRNNTPDPGPKWEVSTLDVGDKGHQTQLAVKPDGTVAVAYYASKGVDGGPCPNLEDPPDGTIWPLFYAEESGDSWAIEEVASPFILGQPPGVSLAVAPDGTPAISTLSGEPLAMQRYCGANDVGFYQRSAPGTWDVSAAVTNSGQAASGEPGSDFGEVVGYWPSLAFDANGEPAIAYKDVHSGSIMSDDLRRADLELAWRQGGGWRAIPVNIGNGSGDFNQLLFSNDNVPYITYFTPWEQIENANLGVWVTRSLDDGASWERAQLFVENTSQGPDGAFDDDGTLHVVFYNSSKGYPQLATLTDSGAFESVSTGWELSDIGDNRYDEGYAPSIAVSPTGNIAVAYYRCTRSQDDLGNCVPADDALIFAWEDGGIWEREVVDSGVDGMCGTSPSLSFDGDGRPVIAYGCEVLVDGLLDDQVKFARRSPLQ